jgi:hypothetical protein
MSLWAVALLGTTPIGAPIVGGVADLLGPRYGLLIGAAGCLTAAVFGSLVYAGHPSASVAVPGRPEPRVTDPDDDLPPLATVVGDVDRPFSPTVTVRQRPLHPTDIPGR